MSSEPIELAFGRDGLVIELPEGIIPTLVRKKVVPVVEDAASAIAAAIDRPVGAPSLVEAAQGARTACILVCDITRPVPNGLFLRPLIDELVAGGIDCANITILVATGLHRPNLGDELAEVIGDEWVLENIAIVNHDARDESAHVMLGATSGRAVPVGIDRRFVDADIRIATGLVEPHFMAGFSGGRKVIAPGIAHESTIRTFHSARFMEDEQARSCNLVGNPLHEEQLEIVEMLGGVIYGLNTVIDEDRQLVFVNFGEIVESHVEAVAVARDASVTSVDRRYSTVVTSAAGHPLDATYYQTVKGMVTPLDILEDGGTLIIVSECREGIGSEDFRASQARLVDIGPEAFLASIWSKDQAGIDEWQTEMQMKAMRRGRVVLCAPHLSDRDHGFSGVERADDVVSAITQSVERYADPHVAVIPEGPYVIPVCAIRT